MSRVGDVGDAIAVRGKHWSRKYLVCWWPQSRSKLRSINAYIAGECEKHPAFIGLAAFHQALEAPEAAIEHAPCIGAAGDKGFIRIFKNLISTIQ